MRPQPLLDSGQPEGNGQLEEVGDPVLLARNEFVSVDEDGAHPEREAIARRYLKHRRSLVDDALAQLTEEPVPAEAVPAAEEETPAVCVLPLCPRCQKAMRRIGSWRPGQPLLYPKRPP